MNITVKTAQGEDVTFTEVNAPLVDEYGALWVTRDADATKIAAFAHQQWVFVRTIDEAARDELHDRAQDLVSLARALGDDPRNRGHHVAARLLEAAHQVDALLNA